MGVAVNFEDEEAEVNGGGGLSGFEERIGSGGEDFESVRELFCFHVALGEDAELLMGFVVLAFFDPELGALAWAQEAWGDDEADDGGVD